MPRMFKEKSLRRTKLIYQVIREDMLKTFKLFIAG